MPVIPNLNMNQHSNLKRSFLGVPKVVNNNRKHKVVEINLYRRTNMKMAKIANDAKYRNDENFDTSQFEPLNFQIVNIKKA